MTRFIGDRLGLSPDAALALQKTYFREHGTTLRGLMTVNRIDPSDFLGYVHDIDLACVPPDPVLVEALATLPGRTIVHTNGSSPHAQPLLAPPAIARSFSCLTPIPSPPTEPQ